MAWEMPRSLEQGAPFLARSLRQKWGFFDSKGTLARRSVEERGLPSL